MLTCCCSQQFTAHVNVDCIVKADERLYDGFIYVNKEFTDSKTSKMALQQVDLNTWGLSIFYRHATRHGNIIKAPQTYM